MEKLRKVTLITIICCLCLVMLCSCGNKFEPEITYESGLTELEIVRNKVLSSEYRENIVSLIPSFIEYIPTDEENVVYGRYCVYMDYIRKNELQTIEFFVELKYHPIGELISEDEIVSCNIISYVIHGNKK